MQKRVKLIRVVILAALLIVCGILLSNKLTGNTRIMEEKNKQAQLELRKDEQTKSEIDVEIKNMDKDSYVIAKAREMGYLRPGEMLFVVQNPDALMDDYDDVVVAEVQEP